MPIAGTRHPLLGGGTGIAHGAANRGDGARRRRAVKTSSRIARWLAGDIRTPEEIRDAVYLVGGDAGAKQSRFWLLLVLAACIATAGVVSDSTATVIGAMIVAPLAVPIQGTAAGIAFGEARPLLGSTAIVLSATAAVIGIGALLEAGTVTLDGDADAVHDFLGLLDDFEFWFDIVTP